LIQLEQLRREREKLKIRISAPEHILRLGDFTARPVKRVQARAIAQKPALHRSINRQAFVSRAVGGGVATDLDRLLTRVLREIVAQERFQPLNDPDVGGTITQKTRLGARGECGDAGLAKEKRHSRLGPQRISVN
jgi:hypothetical protein